MKRISTFQKMTLYAVFALGLLLYFKYFINPVLYFTAQEPIFFFDMPFIGQFVTHPGGMLEYAAALLSQFYYWPWLGAFVLLLLFLSIYILINNLFEKSIGTHSGIVSLLPVIILFYLHHNYNHLLVIDLALLCALSSLLMYSTLKNQTAKLIFILLWSPLFYYITGSSFFIFTLYVIVFELITSKHIIPLVTAVLVAAVLPFLANAILLVRLKDAFYQPALSESLSNMNAVLFLSIAVLMILLSLAKKVVHAMTRKPGFAFVLQTTAAILLFLGASLLAQNTSRKSFYEIIYRAQVGDWQRILEIGKNPYPNSPQIVSLINRALCHTGRMGDELFTYPQEFGLRGLFVMDDAHLSSPLIRSDLYFDLGHYNEAKHWAHEAVSVRGETVWNLQRLVIVLLLDNHKEAARVYLNKLKKTLTAQKWAARYMPFAMGEKRLSDDPEFAALLKKRVHEKFLTFVENPIPDLYKLLEANPQNKAATDYLMAALLLEKRVDRIASLLQQFAQGRKIPRHYQEALVLYVSQARDENVKPRVPVEKQVIESFTNFQKSFQANRQNRGAAQRALGANYGDTFWYYVLFHQRREG